MGRANDVHSLVTSVLRGGRGMMAKARQRAAEPERLLVMYEFES
jgi:hypothetical protein